VLADPRQIAEAFNARAATYRDSDWHRTSAQRLIELSGMQPGDRVLDAGTGTGFAGLAAARLVGPAGTVVGVDLSPGMLAVARESAAQAGLTNFDAVEADATALPQFADGSFDVVTSATSLLYMPAAEALREWARLLRPGGLLALSTMRAGFPFGGRLFRESAAAFGITLADPCEPLGSAESCRRLLTGAGLQVLDILSEPVLFTAGDLSRAWESNLRSPVNTAVQDLPPGELRAIQRRYEDSLRRATETDHDALRRSEMLYVRARR
jgi:SAM-dependent methyltransferase